MKKAIAMKWVEALRSGKYKQGLGRLHNPDTNTYCCLGVLRDISGCKSNDLYETLYDQDVLRSGRGSIESLHIMLTSLNDSYQYCADNSILDRLNFDEIADIIQIFYKEL